MQPHPRTAFRRSASTGPEPKAGTEWQPTVSSAVCYINTAAAIKAEVDICCTSANMLQVVRSLPDQKVIFVPDRNMGRYLQTKLPDRELILWRGVCPTHHRLKPEHVVEQRRLHPGAKFMAHPECRLEVLALADAVLSTTGFLRYAKENAATEFIVGTETGIIPRLEAENPGKRFYPASEQMVCPNMKMTTLEDLHEVLRSEPKDHEIDVPEPIRARAVRALQRMLEIGS